MVSSRPSTRFLLDFLIEMIKDKMRSKKNIIQLIMKKFYLMFVTLFTMTCATAQEVRVPEPESVNSYYVLTSDSTSVALPKESGKLGKHENTAR